MKKEYVYKQNETGKFIRVLEVVEVVDEPEIETDWLHNYQKRIVVNPAILFNEEARGEILRMFALISIRKLPQEEVESGFIHIYANEIKPSEQYIIDEFSEYITVEDRDEQS